MIGPSYGQTPEAVKSRFASPHGSASAPGFGFLSTWSSWLTAIKPRPSEPVTRNAPYAGLRIPVGSPKERLPSPPDSHQYPQFRASSRRECGWNYDLRENPDIKRQAI